MRPISAVVAASKVTYIFLMSWVYKITQKPFGLCHHLADVEEQAQQRIDLVIEQMKEAEKNIDILVAIIPIVEYNIGY
ncbi:MAG: hypothetical protein RR768_05870 [Clostridium sp.]